MFLICFKKKCLLMVHESRNMQHCVICVVLDAIFSFVSGIGTHNGVYQNKTTN